MVREKIYIQMVLDVEIRLDFWVWSRESTTKPMFGENRRLVYCEPVPLGK
jgi:hypothetical protein